MQELLTSDALLAFVKAVEEEPAILIESLWGAPKAALLSLLAKKGKKNILVISSENKLLDDLDYFEVENILSFPSWETLPGEEIQPSPDIIGKRFFVLHELLEEKKKKHLIIAPFQAVLQKIVSPKNFVSKSWKRGDTIPFDSLASDLSALGYKKSAVVADKGEFALRGGILDIFPLSSPDPYRLDFFGDILEDIRTFDPIGQKSIAKVDAIFIPPANELELLKKEKSLSDLLEYLGDETLLVFDDLLDLEDKYVQWQKMPAFQTKFFYTFEEFFKKIKKLPRLYWTKERLEELSHVQINQKVGRKYYSGKEPLQPLTFEFLHQEIPAKRFSHPFVPIKDFFEASTQEELLEAIKRYPNLDLQFICSTESEEKNLKIEAIAKLLCPEKSMILRPFASGSNAATVHLTKPTPSGLAEENGCKWPQKGDFSGQMSFAIASIGKGIIKRGYLSSGFVVADSQLVLLPTTEFTHRYKVRREKWRSTYHTPPSEFHELGPGDIVVHFHQGIGKFLGVEKRKNHLGVETEFMNIEFAEGSKLFVPISQSYLISRYIGAKEELPTLSTLGTKRWQNTKLQAQKAIIGYAQDLLRLSAERQIKGGFSYREDSDEMNLFEEEFPFQETEDQIRAIDDIKSDMVSTKAMDRLVCGDVGYGKTEVAMRAAFKAVVDGKKQVAVLVPTTVLAMQHYETFRDRMANFPINVAVVSRFRSQKEVKETLKKTAEGGVDILIGTHRLISKDVKFKDLGILIIDEEQRFGVRAKEHLKALKTGVDCITLSATPIPRTLYLSLIGAREISIINTPPQDRLPIKSIISEKNPETVQNALLRELSREGQAYYIHNRVESIFLVASELQKLLPQARIVVGHGQMSAEELDTVFHAFKTGQADILVATTIIENGIDIPNANTILIDRADTFGLADLYQIRGRVGRWNKTAYAYFLIPSKRTLPEISRKRLFALVESSGYGGGMKIAMRDLEIRGAGDILGTQQSGQITNIGFHLYCKLLKRTIDALQKKITPSFMETKIEFPYDARLPESYISESSLRLEIYHRLGDTTNLEEIDAIVAELKDRFGPLPPEVIWLYYLTRIRIFAMQKKITSLKIENYTFTVEYANDTKQTYPLKKVKSPQELELQICTHLT